MFIRLFTLVALITAAPSSALAAPLSAGIQVEYSGVSASNFDELFKESDATPAGQIPRGAQRISTSLSMTMRRTELGENRELIDVSDAQIAIALNGQAADGYSREAATGLKAPLLAHRSADGAIKTVYFNREIAQSGRAVWMMVVGFLQYTAPPRLSDTFETIEEDANGRYRAQYTPSESLGLWLPMSLQCVAKTKLEYLPPKFKWVPGTAPAEKLVVSTGSDVWCFRGERFAGMVSEGELFISVAGKAIAYAKGRFVARPVPQTGALTAQSTLATALLKDGRAEVLWNPEVPPEHKTQMYEKELKGRTAQTLVDAFIAAGESPSTERAQRTPLYLATEAFAYLKPSELAPFRKALQAAKTESMIFQVAVPALAKIGNKECQALLRYLFKRAGSDDERKVRLISSLSDASTPEKATVALLKAEARRPAKSLVRMSARLGLGSVSLMLRASGDALHKEIDEWLINGLQTAPGRVEKEEYLRAIGNAGPVSSIEALKPFLTADDEEHRRLAVKALRWNPSELADAVILGVMETDPEAKVRLAALGTYQIRPMSRATMGTHERVARNDPVAKNRVAALNNLLRLRWRYPEVLDTIKERQRDERDQEAREQIEELLAD